MSDTVDPVDPVEPSGWVIGPAECSECGYEWTAQRPLALESDALECPACHEMAGVDAGPAWKRP